VRGIFGRLGGGFWGRVESFGRGEVSGAGVDVPGKDLVISSGSSSGMRGGVLIWDVECAARGLSWCSWRLGFDRRGSCVVGFDRGFRGKGVTARVRALREGVPARVWALREGVTARSPHPGSSPSWLPQFIPGVEPEEASAPRGSPLPSRG
jgi:hypothetical protein